MYFVPGKEIELSEDQVIRHRVTRLRLYTRQNGDFDFAVPFLIIINKLLRLPITIIKPKSHFSPHQSEPILNFISH